MEIAVGTGPLAAGGIVDGGTLYQVVKSLSRSDRSLCLVGNAIIGVSRRGR
jgi:hypothetical protein